MNCKSIKIDDTSGAATELGYIFTFLLGVLLLSVFSIWTWDIETATRDRWNEQAIQMNLDDIAAAIERADEASRLGILNIVNRYGGEQLRRMRIYFSAVNQ